MNKLDVNQNISMRAITAQLIYQEMKINSDIYLLIGDLGYMMWDKIRKDFPDRVINTGAAEQILIGTAVGLALGKKIPIVYSITPFLLYRPFETIRNYINHEKIPVKMLGAGRDKDYEHDGISHWSEDDRSILALWPNIKSFWPNSTKEMPSLIKKMISDPTPYYINLKRK